MKPANTFKIVVHVQRRPGGGLRIWSDDVPGLVLSGANEAAVLADLAPAIETIVSDMLDCAIAVQRLVPLPSHAPAKPSFADQARALFRRTSPEPYEFAAAPCPA